MKFKNWLKSLTLLTAVVTPTTIFTSCKNGNDNNDVKVTRITISGASSVGKGGTITLKASVTPSNATNKKVTWSVSDDAVASVDEDGVLTGLLKGTVTVYATAQDGSGIKGAKKVTVTEPVKVTSITVSKKAVPEKIEVGSSTELVLTVLPSDATNKNVTWTVTPTSVAQVDTKGVFTGLAKGTATVRATATDGTGIYGETTVEVVEAETTTQSYKDYIFDRSFTIAGWGSRYLTHGTGWVLSDATPNDTTDYKYYIATNWHVIKGMEDVGAYEFKYGCQYAEDTAVEQTDEIDFTSFELIDEKNFTYDGKTKITTDEGTGLQGCDIYIALADFGSCTTSTKKCASVAKAKLDRLNALTAAGKKITEIAPTASDNLHYENLKLYTGGYPADNHPGPLWECHDLDDEECTLTYCTHATASSHGNSHAADDSDSPLIDCSPQYAYKVAYQYFQDWMTGGASGSMLIGDFGSGENHVWKVVGIYWGGLGFTEDDHDYIKPYYSIFNSDWKNFVADWM